MSKGATSIKALRENFIKRYQVQPDYFTQGEKQAQEEAAFTDRQMFHPKQYERKNNYHGHGKFITIKQKQDIINQIQSIKVRPKPQSDFKLRIIPKAITPDPRQSQEKLTIYQNYNTIPCQPSLIKTERLKRKVVSAREGRKTIPKYAAYIMKSCSVASMKITPRPGSALVRSKSTELNKYIGFGLKKKQMTQHQKGHQHYLMPWETQYEQV